MEMVQQIYQNRLNVCLMWIFHVKFFGIRFLIIARAVYTCTFANLYFHDNIIIRDWNFRFFDTIS